MQHVFDVAGRVRGLLDGSTASAASHHGMTTDQERALLGTREVSPHRQLFCTQLILSRRTCLEGGVQPLRVDRLYCWRVRHQHALARQPAGWSLGLQGTVYQQQRFMHDALPVFIPCVMWCCLIMSMTSLILHVPASLKQSRSHVQRCWCCATCRPTHRPRP